MTITPADIQAGDTLQSADGTAQWVALQDAVTGTVGMPIITNRVGVQVQHIPDGGIDWRFWEIGSEIRFTTTDTDAGRIITLAA